MECMEIYTNNILLLLPTSEKNEEEKITKRYTCRDFQEPPVESKDVDIFQKRNAFLFSQQSYVNYLQLDKLHKLRV